VTDRTIADSVTPAAGWYSDPAGRFTHRFWDGRAWTDRVRGASVSAPLDATSSEGHRPPAGYSGAPAAVHPYGGYPQAGPPPNFNLPAGAIAPQQILVANASKSPGLAVASLVLGIGAFFFSLIPGVGFSSIPFAITGIALGIAGVARANKGYEGKGLSITGIVASAVALLISVLYLAAISDSMSNDDYYGLGPEAQQAAPELVDGVGAISR
jgi:hypothetical protein